MRQRSQSVTHEGANVPGIKVSSERIVRFQFRLPLMAAGVGRTASAQPVARSIPVDRIRSMSKEKKIAWEVRIVSVQPRIRLTRSFDQRSHTYRGYNLRLGGTIGGEQREFTVAVGKGAHAKDAFKVGDEVSGEAVPVVDKQLETAELCKTSGIKVLNRAPDERAAATCLCYKHAVR